MYILRIEHQIRDFDSWKAAFDRDPIGRQQSGVCRYRILRPIDDPNYVMIDLDFDSSSEQEVASLAALQRDVWASRQVASALVGSPQVRIVEAVESKDSVYNPGADDDASGLASILSTARAPKELDPKHTVHFVAYDLEEDYLVGSSFYVGSVVDAIREEEGNQAVIGNIQSDMVSYDGEGELDVTMETCYRTGAIDDAILRASERIDSPITLIEECVIPSDQVHFWDAGLPAVLLIDDTKRANPWYHEPGDTVDKLDFPYLRAMVQLTTPAAALLTVAPESEATVEQVVPLCGTIRELQRPPYPTG